MVFAYVLTHAGWPAALVLAMAAILVAWLTGWASPALRRGDEPRWHVEQMRGSTLSPMAPGLPWSALLTEGRRLRATLLGVLVAFSGLIMIATFWASRLEMLRSLDQKNTELERLQTQLTQFEIAAGDKREQQRAEDRKQCQELVEEQRRRMEQDGRTAAAIAQTEKNREDDKRAAEQRDVQDYLKKLTAYQTRLQAAFAQCAAPGAATAPGDAPEPPSSIGWLTPAAIPPKH